MPILLLAVCLSAVSHGVQAAPAQPGRPTYATATNAQPTASSLHVWVPSGKFAASSLIKMPRLFVKVPRDDVPRVLHLASVRNAQVSAQLGVAGTSGIVDLRASVSALTSAKGEVIPASASEVRFVGYVPVEARDPRAGGATIAEVAGHAVSGHGDQRVVADPLWSRRSMDVPARKAQPIWFTFHVPASVAPGVYHGDIRITAAGMQTADYPLKLTVQKPVLPDPGDGGVHLNVWFNPDALAVAYGVRPWSEAHWTWIHRYFKFLAKSGQRTILTTIVPHPWRVGWNNWKPQTAVGYDSMVQWSFNGDRWSFNYHRFDRYVRTALESGLGPKVVAYSLLSFRGPQRLTYLDTRTGSVKTREMKVESPFWRHAWCTFVKDFEAHLQQRGWLDHTWLGFDERPAAIIKPAMALLRRCAPKFLHRTEMAGTSKISRYAQDLSLGLTSLRSVPNAWIRKRHQEGKVTTFYTWAGDAHPNTLSFSPSVEARMLGWVVAKRHLDGYLHWAFNDWTRDVFRHSVYAFSQGDEYFVYPGKRGPISSIRWELLQDGIEDAELVRMARQTDSDSKALKEALRLATRNPDGRNKDVHDIPRARAMVVSLLEGSN